MTDQHTAAPERLSQDDARALIERVYGLLNERDVRNISKIFTEDVVVEDDAWPETIRDYGEMERFLSALWRAAPDFRFEVVDGPYVAGDGRRVAVRTRAGGTASGPLDPPGFAPTGTRISTEYAGFFEFEGDRVRRGRIIVNMNDVGVQIGAAPRPGSLGERLAVLMQRLAARRMRKRAAT